MKNVPKKIHAKIVLKPCMHEKSNVSIGNRVFGRGSVKLTSIIDLWTRFHLDKYDGQMAQLI